MISPLASLVEKLEAQKAAKRDVIVPATLLQMDEQANLIIATGAYRPNSVAHSQLAEKAGIPKTYYDRMLRDQPELLSRNVNAWNAANQGKAMVRLFDSQYTGKVARAVMSDRYAAIDNYDTLLATLEAIQSTGVNVKVTKAEVTDNRMHIHVTAPGILTESETIVRQYGKANYGIITGFAIMNSEVGMGAFNIVPRLTVLACTNGMVRKTDAFKRTHLGGRLETGVIDWSATTQRKNLELIVEQVKDAVNKFLSEKYLVDTVRFIEGKGDQQFDHPIEVVTNVCDSFGISKDRKENILDYFIKGGDTRVMGLVQALTLEAHSGSNDADVQWETESIAETVLLKGKEFDHK